MGLFSGYNPVAHKAGQDLVERLGKPDHTTPDEAIWHDKGPFVYSILKDEAVPHSEPMPHKDALTQWVKFKVPRDRIDDVEGISDSIFYDPLKKELGARCQSQHRNVISLIEGIHVARGESTKVAKRHMLRGTPKGPPSVEKQEFMTLKRMLRS